MPVSPFPRLCVFFSSALFPVWALGGPGPGDCPPPMLLPQERVSISSASGIRHFTVEVADTEAARSAGLMCRADLPEGHGMLFVYPRPQKAKMWMKNTRVALDFVFIAANGRIVKLASADPGSAQRIVTDTPVAAVIELPAGTVARHAIRIGDELRREKPGRAKTKQRGEP